MKETLKKVSKPIEYKNGKCEIKGEGIHPLIMAYCHLFIERGIKLSWIWVPTITFKHEIFNLLYFCINKIHP